MIIKADKEGKQAITQLVDLAMKYAGIQVLHLVNQVNAAFKELDTVEKDVERDSS